MASFEPPPGLSFRPLLLAASKAKQEARISTTTRAFPPQTSTCLHLPTLQVSPTRTTTASFPSSTSPSTLLPSLPPPHSQTTPNAEAGPSNFSSHPSYTPTQNPTASETPPVKRGRGRPPGSKNKPKVAEEDRLLPAEPERYPDGSIKKKRGRPKKILSEVELAAIDQKRQDKLNGLIKLGRPPKVRGPDDPPARVRKRAKPKPPPLPQPKSSPKASSSTSPSSPPAHHTGPSSFSILSGSNDTPALEALLLLAVHEGVFPSSSPYPPIPSPLSPSMRPSSSSQIPPPPTGIPSRTLHLPSPPPPPGPMVSGLNDGSSIVSTSSVAANVVEELDLSGLDFAAFESAFGRVLFDVQQRGRARGGMEDDDEEGMQRRELEDEGKRKSRIFSEEEERLGRLHDRPSGSGSSSSAQMTLPQMMLSSNDNDPDPNSLNDNSMYNPPSYSEPYHYPPPMDQLAFDMPTFLREIQEYSRSHFGVVMEDEDGEVGVGGGEGGGGGW